MQVKNFNENFNYNEYESTWFRLYLSYFAYS